MVDIAPLHPPYIQIEGRRVDGAEGEIHHLSDPKPDR